MKAQVMGITSLLNLQTQIPNIRTTFTICTFRHDVEEGT